MSTFRETLDSLTRGGELLAGQLDGEGYGDYAFGLEDSPDESFFSRPEVVQAREQVIAAAERILLLARGPRDYMHNALRMGQKMGVIHALLALGVPGMVPADSSITYETLAAESQVSASILKRLLRLVIRGGFMTEDEEGSVRHTPASLVFLRDPELAEMILFRIEFLTPSFAHFYASLRADPEAQTPETAPAALFAQRYYDMPRDTTFWDFLDGQPGYRRVFHQVMLRLAAVPAHSPAHVSAAFDWTKIKTLVDVGGSHGHIAQAIAQDFPHIQITVQDRPATIKEGEESRVQKHCGDRISYMGHDFFSPQPVTADAYLLRAVLHDWPDRQAQCIIKSLVSGFRPGARLMVMEHCVLPAGTEAGSAAIRSEVAVSDIMMFTLLCARERTLQDMRELVEFCEPRFVFEGAETPLGSSYTLMTWVFTEEA